MLQKRQNLWSIAAKVLPSSPLYIFVPLQLARNALMRHFNSRDGFLKPIPGIKLTPEGIPGQREGHKMYKVELKEAAKNE